MSDKARFINEYFKQWGRDIVRARELLINPHYYLEGLLVLSCYIGAFASMRFPSIPDGKAYVKIVLEYSGKRDFYEQIDLLFFYQWPRSKLRGNGDYKALKNRDEIVDVLKRVYGSEAGIKVGIRYVSPPELIDHVLAAAIPSFDEKNFRMKLPLFYLSELLYRYLRCDAVHNADFPFVNKLVDIDGNITYESNHIITGPLLLETVESIHKTIRDECLDKLKWPHEL